MFRLSVQSSSGGRARTHPPAKKTLAGCDNCFIPFVQTIEEQSLAERLKPRVAKEKQFEATGRKLRNKSWLFRHEKVWVRPILKFGLKITGLYNRGLRNALQPVVRHHVIWSQRLPAAFDGYKILHVSDLHIDGRPLLTEKLGQLLGKLDADVCLITGDYR